MPESSRVSVGMRDAPRQLSRLVDQVLEGREVVVTRRGEPVVRLVAARPAVCSFAALRGTVPELRIADDFDALPDEIARALGMRDDAT